MIKAFYCSATPKFSRKIQFFALAGKTAHVEFVITSSKILYFYESKYQALGFQYTLLFYNIPAAFFA